MISLIDNLAMLPAPGMSRPAAFSAFTRSVSVPADLVERVQPHQVLAHGRVVDRAVRLRQLDEHLLRRRRPSHRRRRAPGGRGRCGRSRRRAWAGRRRSCPGWRARAGAPAPAPRPLRSNIERRVGDRPPVVDAADDRVVGHAASLRNTSLNNARPVISRSGRTSTPGWCMSNANQVMPWCLGTSGLVRAISMPMSAIWPPRRPHLLTVDDPLVAVLHRARAEAGEVAAGARAR